MGAIAAVNGNCGPTVLEDADFRAAGIDHRFDGEDHAGLETRAFTGVAEVGNLGIFVHGAADSVADKLADNAEAFGLAELLNGGGDVAETAPHLALLDGSFERGLGDFE
jgi:hypothetical protein